MTTDPEFSEFAIVGVLFIITGVVSYVEEQT